MDPDVFIWLGDAAYIDNKSKLFPFKFNSDTNYTRVNEKF